MYRKYPAVAIVVLLLVVPSAFAQTDTAAWKHDLDVIKTELPKRHINLFFKISRADFERRIEQLQARLPAMNDDERYVEMSKIVASVGDPHTSVSRPSTAALPLMVYRFRDGLYIVNTIEDYKALLYGQVLAIGGRPIAEVEGAIAGMVPHDNEATVWQALARLTAMADVLHGLGIAQDTSGATVTVKKPDGETVTARLPAISLAQRPLWVVRAANSDAVPLYRRNGNKFYWYEYLPESKTLYVKYNSCQEMNDVPFKDFTREVFERLDQAPEARLVVDLRNNGGGNSGIFQPFLDALKRRPAVGEKGRLFVIIGRQTFSSAILNAVALKQQAKAVFVGEPTSGRANHYGELQTFDLPGTGLKVTYSTQYFKPSADNRPTLEPDIRVDPTVSDYAAGRDPVLERIR